MRRRYHRPQRPPSQQGGQNPKPQGVNPPCASAPGANPPEQKPAPGQKPPEAKQGEAKQGQARQGQRRRPKSSQGQRGEGQGRQSQPDLGQAGQSQPSQGQPSQSQPSQSQPSQGQAGQRRQGQRQQGQKQQAQRRSEQAQPRQGEQGQGQGGQGEARKRRQRKDQPGRAGQQGQGQSGQGGQNPGSQGQGRQEQGSQGQGSQGQGSKAQDRPGQRTQGQGRQGQRPPRAAGSSRALGAPGRQFRRGQPLRPPPDALPIERKDGIRARSQRGAFATNWWAERWIAALERVVATGRLNRGRTYAREGQVLSLDEAEGAVHARVQGTRPRPYKVTIKLKPLTDTQWNKVVDALAGQALFAAQLLAGEMPQEIDAVFAAAGSSLFPATEKELETECSCPDWANPCKHVAATYYILAEQLDEDPFLLFRLRGRSQEQVMAALRARRSEGPQAAGEQADLSPAGEEAPPLDADLEHFYRMGDAGDAGNAAIQVSIKPPATPLPLLKRLGQPPFLDENIELALGPAYRGMQQAALAAAFEGDG